MSNRVRLIVFLTLITPSNILLFPQVMKCSPNISTFNTFVNAKYPVVLQRMVASVPNN